MKNKKEAFLSLFRLNKEAMIKLFLSITTLLVFCWLIELLITTFAISPHTVLNNSVFHHHLTDSFYDFYNINDFFYNRSPYIECDSSYPPFNFIIASPFVEIQKHDKFAARNVYIIVFVCLLILISVLTIRKYKLGLVNSILLPITCFVSAPLLFLLERGNYLIFTFTFVCLFLLSYDSKNIVIRELSYVWLAMAIATKFYPVAFALLLLKEKRIIDLLKAAGYTIILLVVPFFAMNGGFTSNIQAFLGHLRTFSSYQRLSVDISTNNMFRIFAYMFGFDYNSNALSIFATVVRFTLFFVMIVAIIFTKKKWQAITLASLAAVIVPAPAMIHSLVFVIVGVVSFLLEEEKIKIDYVYMGLFIIMITPLQFGYIIEPVPFAEQTSTIQETNPNYLGLSVNTLLEAMSAFAMASIVSVRVIIATIKDFKSKSHAN